MSCKDPNCPVHGHLNQPTQPSRKDWRAQMEENTQRDIKAGLCAEGSISDHIIDYDINQLAGKLTQAFMAGYNNTDANPENLSEANLTKLIGIIQVAPNWWADHHIAMFAIGQLVRDYHDWASQFPKDSMALSPYATPSEKHAAMEGKKPMRNRAAEIMKRQDKPAIMELNAMLATLFK